ncbi:MAG: DUF1552 domain-containing protein [Acidobacteria bacterium]|nr:DUF1552 domain-containing protein [Acidobacteriota bacterium]
MITRKHLPRRTFLKGFGATIALPLLDAMTPAFGATRLAGKAPSRMAFVYVPNGIIMQGWTPQAEGAGFDLPAILEPVAAYRDDLIVFSGLTHNGGRALGDGPGDHARAAASFLTGIHPRKTAGADIHAGVSVDQVAAQKIGSATRFASLELGIEDGRQVGNCDSGYSCAYSNNLSWRSESTPNPPEINPRAVFERLFGNADEDPATRAKRERYNKSILDFVSEDTQKLKGTLGPTDRRKLDEYLVAVREIEKRIEAAERDSLAAPAMGKPSGIPVDFTEHVHLMFDLMAVAFQADLTRVMTFMMAREGSTRTYREIGISDGHHPLTHHRNQEDMVEKVRKINRFHVEQFAYFLGKLKSIPDGDGTLLDHSMVTYGSGLADGNRHTHHDLPVLLAGRLEGFRPGRHLRYPKETPMANLYLAMLDRMGVQTEKLGDSNGKLEQLSSL